ncbi:hypothetical protein [Bifidobacterium pullorum]|uniref:hypothetical protein n=1 Tax=Bifidobacterium pullorum TaxID=78448 RepID=UPI0024AD3B6B|nr:hypothetical protein [Bifidobacterium pullorum]
MAVNVTQKDKTLNEVIDICEHLMGNPPLHLPAFADGWNGALRAVIRRCRKRLGYTGSMPLEVPNQSERADAANGDPSHEMTVVLKTVDWGEPLTIDRYRCSCGYSTYDEYEATSHINVQAQRKRKGIGK